MLPALAERLQTKRILHKVVLALLLLAALANAARIVTNNRYLYGAGDFYAYWYYGQFVRQQTNPYAAILEPIEPEVPVRLIGGQTYSHLPELWSGLGIPTLTAPLLWLLSLFSWLPWPTAKYLWLIINFGLTVATPWLLLRLTPHRERWSIFSKAVLYLSYATLSAVRLNGGNGQTAQLVFFLMLAALQQSDRRPLASGVLAGLALSKYSLALPLVPLMVYRRRWRQLAVAGFIQLIAAVGLALLGADTPSTVLRAYVDVLARSTVQRGIHLSYVIPGFLGPALAVISSVAVWGLVIAWLRRPATGVAFQALDRLVDLHLLLIWALWTLLVAYHGRYDAVLVILFYGLLLGQDALPNELRWRITPVEARRLRVIAIVAMVPLFLPVALTFTYPPEISEIWLRVNLALFSLTLLSILALSTWLLYRLPIGDRHIY